MHKLPEGMNFESATAKLKCKAILNAVREQELSLYEIADIIYISAPWTRRYLNYLMDQDLVHVSGHRRDISVRYGSNDTRRAVYAFGPQKDPEKREHREIMTQKKYLLIKKLREQEPEDDLKFNKRHRTNYIIRRDPLVAALFGNP